MASEKQQSETSSYSHKADLKESSMKIKENYSPRLAWSCAKRLTGVDAESSGFVSSTLADFTDSPKIGAFVIGVAGGSATGKTTVCNKIIQGLGDCRCVMIALDWFYKGLTVGQDPTTYNFDHPDAFDFELLATCLKNIASGEPIYVPCYDYTTHKRTSESRLVNPGEVVIVEGIQTFYPPEIRNMLHMKIFVDEDPDTCLCRRIRRDVSSRGRTVESVLKQYETFVKPSYEEFIAPTKRYADLIVPRGAENVVAIDLVIKHIALKLRQPDLRRLYPNLVIMGDNPQIQGLHSVFRDRESSREDFIFHADRLIRLVVEEGLGLLPFQQSSVFTPTGEVYHGLRYAADLASVSIMRGGDAMEAGLRAVCKNICIGKMLIAKDPSEPESERQVIYCKLSSGMENKHVFLLDPILGSGKTAIKAVEELLRRGCKEENIIILTLVASSEGIRRCCEHFPQLRLVTTAVDQFRSSEGRVEYSNVETTERKEFPEHVFENGKERFYTYYKEQKVVADNEWPAFVNSLNTPLPACFWISRSHPSGLYFKQLWKYLEEHSIYDKDRELFQEQRPFPLAWYPDELAWCLNLSRQMLRRNEKLSQLHNFIMEQNNAGVINRQEAVSMLPPLVLDLQPGDKVLDMCAAPGSKTAQVLDLLINNFEEMDNEKSMVVANDSNLKRCWMLVHQLKRFSCPFLVITNHEAQKFPLNFRFNKILCDVPCSGDGTLRKSPDLWRRWHADIGMNLHRLQVSILMRGCQLLEPGGRLVYSTCSLNPVENEAVVAEVLRQCSSQVMLISVGNKLRGLKYREGLTYWKVKNNAKDTSFFSSFDEVPLHRRKKIPASLFPQDDLDKLGLKNCVRVLPHDQDSGGFFLAVLEKKLSNDQVDNQEHLASKPSLNKRTGRASRLIADDPFRNLSELSHSLVEDIALFYGIDDQLLKQRLMTRTNDPEKIRKIYYLTEHVKSLVNKSVGNCEDLSIAEEEEHPYRVVHGGLRLLEAMDCNIKLIVPIVWFSRVLDSLLGGKLTVLLFLCFEKTSIRRMNRRVVSISTEETWNFLLSVNQNIRLEDIVFSELRATLQQMKCGSLLLCFRNEHGTDYLTAWLGPTMLSIFVTPEDIMLLRSRWKNNLAFLNEYVS
eukprot:jgi/Galph1/5591/GphlegSOOS_G4228.1